MSDEVDVVVVGAGLSGLVTARDLVRGGAQVLVLEAADRVGGRSMTVTSVLGSRLDLGGQWVGRDHHRLEALADEHGATRYRMHTPPFPTVVRDGRRLGMLSASVLRSVVQLTRLNLARRRPRDDWDTTTVAAWLQKAPRSTRRLLEVAALISWTADLDRVSVRTMMSAIRVQHGLVTMLSTKGGAQDSLITEGAGHLAERIAEDLGDVVRTGARVTTIVRDDAGVVVRTADGEVRAQRVVVTAPPPTAARITHEPPLPAERTALQDGTFMGSVYKAIAVYDEPFWRATASGELLLLDQPGIAVFDSTAPGGPGHLCLLVGGPDARALDDFEPEERKSSLLGRIAERLGPGVLTPVDWHEKSWHLDPDAGGGYLAVPVVGSAAQELPFDAAPLGRLHWGGSETATDHPGYLDGAIEAGERAAAEVLAALA